MKPTGLNNAARAEWKAGWPLIIAASAGMGLTSPLMVYSMGLFIAPLEQEFGWSRALITSGLTVSAGVAVLFSWFVGSLIDRFGPRRIAIPGVIIYCAAFAALSSTTGAPAHWWALWLAVAVGALFVSPTIWTAAVASRFDASRGLAIASLSFGASLSGLLAPLVAGYLIATQGWRWGYIGMAVIWLAVVLPLVLLSFRGALDGTRRTNADTAVERPEVPGLPFGQAVQSIVFIKLALASMLIMLVLTSATIHFVPIITAAGMDRATAVGFASVIGFSSILGRLFSGVMLDRFRGTVIGGAMFVLPAFAFFALILFDGSVLFAGMIALLIGFTSGAEMEVAAYLSSRYFGMRNYASIYGLIIGLLALALGLGPMIAGYIYDSFGSYAPALWAAIPISLLASALIFSLGPYPQPAVE